MASAIPIILAAPLSSLGGGAYIQRAGASRLWR